MRLLFSGTSSRITWHYAISSRIKLFLISSKRILNDFCTNSQLITRLLMSPFIFARWLHTWTLVWNVIIEHVVFRLLQTQSICFILNLLLLKSAAICRNLWQNGLILVILDFRFQMLFFPCIAGRRCQHHDQFARCIVLIPIIRQYMLILLNYGQCLRYTFFLLVLLINWLVLLKVFFTCDMVGIVSIWLWFSCNELFQEVFNVESLQGGIIDAHFLQVSFMLLDFILRL